jgi:hypothetical protein
MLTFENVLFSGVSSLNKSKSGIQTLNSNRKLRDTTAVEILSVSANLKAPGSPLSTCVLHIVTLHIPKLIHSLFGDITNKPARPHNQDTREL